MKKYYGVHRLYGGFPSELSLQVIAVENGRCVAYRPLTEETAFTEWVGGAAILSAKEEADTQLRLPMSMDAVRAILLATPGNHVWHVDADDCSSGIVSHIRRLG